MASFLGVDISKETFHASLLSDRSEAKKVFPNTPKGFEQLVGVASRTDAPTTSAFAWRPRARIGRRWRSIFTGSGSM